MAFQGWRSRQAIAGAVILIAGAAALSLFLLSRNEDEPPAAAAGQGDAQGMLPASALPAGGWAPAADASLEALPEGLIFSVVPPFPECAGMSALEETLQSLDTAFSNGRSRRFTDGPTTSVTHLRVAFSDAAAPATALAAIEASFRDGAVGRCLEAAARADGADVVAVESGIASLPAGAAGTSIRLAQTGTATAIASEVLVWLHEGSTFAALNIVRTGEPLVGRELTAIVDGAVAATRQAVAK